MKDHKTIKRLAAMLVAALLTLSALSGCAPGGGSDGVTEAQEVSAFADDDSVYDWQSLYYERLRVLDRSVYTECALLYIDDNGVPELYIKTASNAAKDYLCSLDESGLFVNTSFLEPVESMMYIERGGSFVIYSCYDQNEYYKAEGFSFTPEYRYHKGATVYSFDGDLASEEHGFYNEMDDLDDDDGIYDSYFGNDEDGVRIPEDIKDYFDVDRATEVKTSPIDDVIELLKGARKAPNRKAGAYDGKVSDIVSTYKEVSKTVSYFGENRKVSYKIPQIDLSGGQIESINQAILDDLLPLVEAVEADGFKIDADNYMAEFRYFSYDYRAYLTNGVLSLVIDKTGTGGTDGPDSKVIYNIDVVSLTQIDNVCLLNSFGTDCLKVEAAFEKYNEEDYYGLRDDPERSLSKMISGYYDSIYDDLINKTLGMFSPVGTHMFFDDKGDLHIYYYRAWIAGSEYYGTEMTVSKSDL